MNKVGLRIKHFKVVIGREFLCLFKAFGLKNLIAKEIESKGRIKSDETININSKNRNIIVLPNIPWNYRWQRPQQIFSRLSKKGFNIFYISPVTSNEEYLSKISENIFEVHIKTVTRGNVLRDFHLDEANTKAFIDSFKSLLEEYIRKDSLLFALHPVWKDVVFGLKNIKKVYDLMDLYSGFPNAREELVIAEEELIERSDIVITTATSLYNHSKKLNKNTYMLRNGSDYEKFTTLKENGELDNLKEKPIVGYFGAITDWLDFDLMEYIVKENRDKYFVFIGALNTNGVRRLYKYTNVYFMGEVNHSKLPGYLAYFDVCTIPFILNDLIKSTNPVKFYEYIASGKPVVSVDLPELKQYSDICYLSKNKEEFSKNIFRALHDDSKQIEQKRKETAKVNSWDNRIQELIKII